MFEVSDKERTLNYAKFQLSLVMEKLHEHYDRGSSRLCFAHLVTAKEELHNEISELRSELYQERQQRQTRSRRKK